MTHAYTSGHTSASMYWSPTYTQHIRQLLPSKLRLVALFDCNLSPLVSLAYIGTDMPLQLKILFCSFLPLSPRLTAATQFQPAVLPTNRHQIRTFPSRCPSPPILYPPPRRWHYTPYFPRMYVEARPTMRIAMPHIQPLQGQQLPGTPPSESVAAIMELGFTR